MLESPSGLQIANFRRAGSISAFSADTNAYLAMERGTPLPSSSLLRACHRPRVRMDGKERGRWGPEKNSIDDTFVDGRRMFVGKWVIEIFFEIKLRKYN